MRQVHIPALQRDVSALGFGCASLGSRVAAADGRRAAFRALDLGVSWFDVAPPYGDGHAEEILGRILGGRRKDVVICTKFGIARPSISLSRRLLRPLARRLVAWAPTVRTLASGSRSTGAKAPIEPGRIEGWVVESLRRLNTDYIDVLAVHEPSAAEAADADIHAALDALKRKGLVRAVSIGGSPEAIASAANAGWALDLVQFPDSPFDDAAPRLRRCPWPRQPAFVTHGVFGSGSLARLRALGAPLVEALRELAKRQGLAADHVEAGLLSRFAFANNPDGVVIASMFTASHIESNVAAAGMVPDPRFADELRRLLNAPTVAVTPHGAAAFK